MNGKGRASDNIAIERFFRTLKYENIYLNSYDTINELREGVSRYIGFYNNIRFHSSLNYKRPMQVYFRDIKSAA